MERPLIPPDSIERAFLSFSNYVFTFVFAIEMMLKVFAVGMFYGTNAYFTSGWNIMDGLLVTVSIVDILMSLLSSGSPRIFGILRVWKRFFSLSSIFKLLFFCCRSSDCCDLYDHCVLSTGRPVWNWWFKLYSLLWNQSETSYSFAVLSSSFLAFWGFRLVSIHRIEWTVFNTTIWWWTTFSR